MNKTHWLQNPNKNYMGEWDLPDTETIVLTIKSAAWEPVEDPIKKEIESLRVIRWEEENIKPLICNQTNSERIVKVTGKRYMEDSIGCKIGLKRELYVDKRNKDEMMVVRVDPNPVKEKEIEVLTKNHQHFDQVKKAWKEGKKEAIQKRFKISPEIKKLLEA